MMKRTFPNLPRRKNHPIPKGLISHETTYRIVGWRIDEYHSKEGAGNNAIESRSSVPGDERVSFGELTLEEAQAAWKAAYKAIRKARGLA